MNEVYIVEENLGACVACGRAGEDLRFGHCWDCAEAESIIADGTDMYERDINGAENGNDSKTAMQKVHYLIKKGWRPPEALPNESGLGGQEGPLPSITQKEAGE
jgi:hypothetical protein